MSSLSFQDENQPWNLPNGLPAHSLWGQANPAHARKDKLNNMSLVLIYL